MTTGPIEVHCADCQAIVTNTLDLAQYWDWTNNYSPVKHVVCVPCYNEAKRRQDAAQKK